MKIKPAHFFLPKLVTITLFICFVLLESCSSTAPVTQITGSWKDPEAKNYNNFFVAVLSKNLPARSTLEQDISRRLKQEGAKVTESITIFPHTENVESAEERKAAVEKIQSLGNDAIITVTLIKKTEENRYVPGANSYTPTNIGQGSGYYNPVRGGDPGTGTYGSFGTFYANASSAYTTPGYYETDKVYFVESRVFDLKTSKLVWSAQSETFDPGNIASASGDFSLVMVEAMKKAKLIYKEEKGK